MRVRRPPVPPSSPGFLDVIDQGPGDAKVPDMPDVGDVDTCPEERGGDHDILAITPGELVVDIPQFIDRALVTVVGGAAQERCQVLRGLVAPAKNEALLASPVRSSSFLHALHQAILCGNLAVEDVDVVGDLRSRGGRPYDDTVLDRELLQELALKLRRARGRHQQEGNLFGEGVS